MDARRVLESFPLPISRGYRRFWNAVETRERHDAAYYLYEIYLKYLSSIAISEYLAQDAREHRVNAALKGLARPTLGEWVRFLRECLSFLDRGQGSHPSVKTISSLYFRKNGEWSTVTRLYNSVTLLLGEAEHHKEQVSLKMLLGAVVAYRNSVLGHGAPLEEAHYEEFGKVFGQTFAGIIHQGLEKKRKNRFRCLVSKANGE
jgi:hypothetical protein